MLDLELSVGPHSDPAEGTCFLEAVALIAGEPHSDRPRCVSPMLGKLGRRLNDHLPDDLRQRLIPLIPRMVGTADDGLDEAREQLALDWLFRTYVPTWLDLIGLGEHSTTLRNTPQLDDAVPIMLSARAAAKATADKVDWKAAVTAAHAATMLASRATASTAPALVAETAAVGAARVTAWPVLKPVVTTLQISAIDLLDRMMPA